MDGVPKDFPWFPQSPCSNSVPVSRWPCRGMCILCQDYCLSDWLKLFPVLNNKLLGNTIYLDGSAIPLAPHNLCKLIHCCNSLLVVVILLMLLHDVNSIFKVGWSIADERTSMSTKVLPSVEQHTRKVIATILLLILYLSHGYLLTHWCWKLLPWEFFSEFVQQTRRKMVINELVLLMINSSVPLWNLAPSIATERDNSSVRCFRSGGELGPGLSSSVLYMRLLYILSCSVLKHYALLHIATLFYHTQ